MPGNRSFRPSYGSAFPPPTPFPPRKQQNTLTKRICYFNYGKGKKNALRGSISFTFGPRLIVLLHFRIFISSYFLSLRIHKLLTFLPLRLRAPCLFFIFFLFLPLYLSQIFALLYPYVSAHSDILPALGTLAGNFSRRGPTKRINLMTIANVTYTSSPFIDAKSVYIQVVSACINLVLKTSYASEINTAFIAVPGQAL